MGKGWVCPGCVTRTRKGDNTPVRNVTQDAPGPRAAPATSAAASASAAAACAATSAAAAAAAAPPAATPPAAAPPAAPALNLDMHKEMSEWMLEIREFRREMTEFRGSIASLSSRMDTIELRLETVERAREDSSPEVADLRCKVALLQQELNDRDQEALLSDLEIGHLPEQSGESVMHTVTVLASKLGVVLDERDIVFAERIGVAQGAAAAGEAPRERRVVVRLARRHLRDQIIQAARVRRTLTAADAGSDAARSQTRIYVNERLTRTNRLLFHRVREECRRLQWRYSWTRRGRVYARQSGVRATASRRIRLSRRSIWNVFLSKALFDYIVESCNLDSCVSIYYYFFEDLCGVILRHSMFFHNKVLVTFTCFIILVLYFCLLLFILVISSYLIYTARFCVQTSLLIIFCGKYFSFFSLLFNYSYTSFASLLCVSGQSIVLHFL